MIALIIILVVGLGSVCLVLNRLVNEITLSNDKIFLLTVHIKEIQKTLDAEDSNA